MTVLNRFLFFKQISQKKSSTSEKQRKRVRTGLMTENFTLCHATLKKRFPFRSLTKVRVGERAC